ncbi:hypothetical protein C8Q78DRAFT_993412 [Trametes maxima]|nr:hypothetical protein C8Q78DRAFT_993412 [Trametes maxima]
MCELLVLNAQTLLRQDGWAELRRIKLIVALNEQFMVAFIVPPNSPKEPMSRQVPGPEGNNRTLPTFSENLIFMLNRADRTAEDLCMQLLVLKLLYLLFTTKGMSEYFYTNGLSNLAATVTAHVPVPVVENQSIRDIDPMMKHLVTCCLGGEWCVQFRKDNPANTEQRKFSMWEDDVHRSESPGLDAVSSALTPHSAGPTTQSGGVSAQLERMGSLLGKHWKASRSAELLPLPTTTSLSASRTTPHHACTDEQPPYKVSSDSAPFSTVDVDGHTSHLLIPITAQSGQTNQSTLLYIRTDLFNGLHDVWVDNNPP